MTAPRLSTLASHMTTQASQPASQTASHAADAWRDIWVDPETARINARRDELQHDADDMAEFYRLARLAR